jgi:hypothetical protein
MKNLFISVLLIFIAVFFTACEHIDNQPPSPPSGLNIINGDNQVYLSWNNSPSRDVAGYNVYYAYSYDGKYTLIGSTSNNYYIDYGAHNGNTYYYAVTAYDYNGNESELSYDNVSATPRPQGLNKEVFDYRNYPNLGGFSFSSYSVVPYNDSTSDFFYENYNGTFYIDVWSDTDIEDMGLTNDIYDIPYAPTSGWSSTHDVIAIPGHTYVIWTWDNYYAKIRVSSVTNSRMVFDWAFQTLQGNTQLKIKSFNAKRLPLVMSSFNR